LIDEIGRHAGLIPKNGLTMMGGNWYPEQVRLRNDVLVRILYQSRVNKRLLTLYGDMGELVDPLVLETSAEICVSVRVRLSLPKRWLLQT
jgi:hypothetical protein